VSGQTIESRSPQAPDDVVISAPATDRKGVLRAAEQARESAAAWGVASAAERADALLGAGESLADVAEDVAELST
jgi:alpha-ketoglutaric semialdehyde dehydrogenase